MIHKAHLPYVYPLNKTTLRVRLITKKQLTIYVIHKNIYNHDASIYQKEKMKLIFVHDSHYYYEADCSNDHGYFKYCFLIADDEGYYFNSEGINKELNLKEFFHYPVINEADIIKVPDFYQGALYYQVLIDRFYQGKIRTNFHDLKDIKEKPDRNTYYGGNYQGLQEKLPYIKKLGANVLVLSPLFLSPTYHKYDIKDYYQIDDIYGSVEDLKSLIEECHQIGMKVIFDGVFNHLSNENELFKDVILKQDKSRYRAWFYLDEFPVDEQKVNYDTFGNRLVGSMPRLNTNNDEVIDYLTKASIYWMKILNFDGWRLDVYDEVSPKFWRYFKKEVIKQNSNAILIGEVWTPAERWLDGTQMDTMTNYRFRTYLLELFEGKISVKSFWDKTKKYYANYPSIYYNYFVNVLGSHDTIRIAELFELEKIKLINVLLLTFPGSPMIYYGDELYLKGDVDPDNRRAMRFDYLNDEKKRCLFDLLCELGKLRQKDVIKKGTLKILDYGNNCLAYERIYQNEIIGVIINLGEEIKISDKEVLLTNKTRKDYLKKYQYLIYKGEE